MSLVYKDSSFNQEDRPKAWATEDYLSEMRTRLSKLRALQDEFVEHDATEPVASN